MKENRKKVIMYTTLGIIALGIVALTITYAYWRLTREQTKHNIISTGCFNIDFVGENDILLEKAYPISDDDGKILDPYTFTITNHCEAKADYTINLEMLAGTNLASDYVKILLNEKGVEATPNLLNSYDNYESDEEYKVANAVEGRKLLTGTLEALDEKKYELRIWLGSNAKIEDDTMNKTYKSKIVVDTSFKVEGGLGGSTPPSEQTNPTIELGTDIPPVENGDGLYAVTHEDLEELGQEWNKTEYRYAGVDPDNYVSFNNEIWRIIGLVNVKVGDNIEQRLKIVRPVGVNNQKSIGSYCWDKNNKNDWTISTLKDMLNGIYYNSQRGYCYTLEENFTLTKNICDFTGTSDLPKGLDETAREMIDKEVIWNLGGWKNAKIPTKQCYEKERGTEVTKGSPTEWSSETDVGEKYNGIGLMYPSDYGYAVGGEVRNYCLTKNLGSYYYDDCYANVWLNPDKDSRKLWALMPSSFVDSTIYTFGSNGYIDIVYTAENDFTVWPTLYLKSSVKITSNPKPEQEYGTIDNPFVLSM